MAHLTDYLSDINTAQKRYGDIKNLVHRCFEEERRTCNLNLGEFITEQEYVVYNGIKLSTSLLMFTQAESSLVPEKYLKDYVDMLEAESDAMAWLRIWNNFCDTYEDFKAGLPGESNVLSSPTMQEKWQEMSQGEAFADLEGRIFAYKLLRGN